MVALPADSPTLFYSVKFSELCPELESISDVDCAVMLNYGIEVNMRLLPSNFCTSYTPNMRATGVTAAVGTLVPYSISDVFIGSVIKDFGKIPRPMTTEIGFKTYHYVK